MVSTGVLDVLEPTVLEISAEDGEPTLLGSRCRLCGRVFFPARVACAGCADETTTTVRLSQEGELQSFTEVHRKPKYARVDPPYVLGEVTLPDGLFVYSVLVSEAQHKWTIGEPVRLTTTVVQLEDGQRVNAYAFKPAG
jgi:uncharacterized OB-fold protein